MMEYWNIGNQKRMMVWLLILNRTIFIKTDPIPLNAAFHHSSRRVGCAHQNALISSFKGGHSPPIYSINLNLEYWSIGVSKEDIRPSANTPALQYSNTPKLIKI
jgi:hypothetical protein